MIGKKPAEHQMSIFEVALESFIDRNHELVLLSRQIDWVEVESDFAEYYCEEKIVKISLTAAAAFNMRHWMNKNDLSFFVSWLKTLVGHVEKVLFENINQYACWRSALAMVAK